MHDVDAVNAGYARLLLDDYLDDPDSVPAEWRTLFEGGEALSGLPGLDRILARLPSNGARNGHDHTPPAPVAQSAVDPAAAPPALAAPDAPAVEAGPALTLAPPAPAAVEAPSGARTPLADVLRLSAPPDRQAGATEVTTTPLDPELLGGVAAGDGARQGLPHARPSRRRASTRSARSRSATRRSTRSASSRR